MRECGKDQWYFGWHQCDVKDGRFQEECGQERMAVGFSDIRGHRWAMGSVAFPPVLLPLLPQIPFTPSFLPGVHGLHSTLPPSLNPTIPSLYPSSPLPTCTSSIPSISHPHPIPLCTTATLGSPDSCHRDGGTGAELGK